MHKTNNTQTNSRMKRLAKPLLTWILIMALMIQTLALSCSALVTNLSSLIGVPGAKEEIFSGGIGKFDSDETIARLKKEFLKSINQDLLKKVEDYELRGEVDVILTFSDNSLVSSFADAKLDMTYGEYRTSPSAAKLREKLAANQNKVLARLEEAGLISEIKYRYYHVADGAYVSTTYEQLSAICEIEGVERVMLSNTYEPAIAVENPVNVYDTGIFNSADVSYTGKKTIVAILDTGCDYTHTAFTTHQVVDPLYNRDMIEALLADTEAYGYDNSLEAREVYYGNLTGNKIAFGYDYADKDPDIMPFANEHGTHVAGIIGGKDDTITGVAIDTQLAIMKVFSDYEVGAEDGDILAALEDSIILGVDAINMSLGTSCGFTREVDDEYKNELYDNIEVAGISLIVAASNDYSSGFGSEEGNTNKSDNPDSATVGSPSTYTAALSVASINGNKDKYMLANGEYEIFFHESVNQSAKEYDFFAMLGVTPGHPLEYEYVTIPGVGMPINYEGVDIAGKIALVRRGDITFEEKMQYAYEAGAIAIIIYNNVFGDIIMTVGNDTKIPVISIGKDEGDLLAEQKSGKLSFKYENQAGPFMSDFSSWGPNPDLSLKPEITAHGGNILSAIPGGGYDKLSGTSMAAPNMCGITVLIRQYVKEKYPDWTPEQVRDLVNQLCMSTATIALDRKGNPYSPRKQGAGIADILKATTTPAYLFVEGLGKTKLELGDDPTRSGVYTMSINLKNISDKTVSYRIGNIAMTETLSTSDPEYVAEIGYILSNSSEYAVENATFTDGVISVEAGKTAKITVTLKLSAADKSYLNASFKNGMYVEGFLTFDNTDANGVDLNAPFLAFYGDWGEAPIFDLDYYEVETEAHNNAIDDEDKIKADYYPTTPTGTYYYDYILPLGSYVYTMDESLYTPIPATEEKAALSYYADSISGIYGVFAGLLRGAKELNISIKNATTGEEVWSDTQYNCYKSHYNGSPYPYVSMMRLPMANYETGDVFGYNNQRFEVTLSAKLDWDGDNRNSNDTYSFSFYIDYEAPTITDATFRTEYDKALEENRYYVDLMVYDNHYAMSLRPIIVYDDPTATEDDEVQDRKTYSSLCENPIPIYQEGRGTVTKVSVEITDYIELVKNSSMPEGLCFYLDDYAMNSSVCYVPFPETENTDLEFLTPSVDMDINQTMDLTTYLARKDADVIEAGYLKNLTWSSSDESVVAISPEGQIEALKAGSATVSVTASSWTYTETVNGEEVEKPLYKTLIINVSENSVDNPDSADNVQIEDLKFTSYKTLFAFNSDIDYSEIGITDSISYFGGNYSIAFYPSEQVQLEYRLDPWNLSPDRYELKWSSSNPKVATVDENGVVTAEAEGKARITLQVTIDGKTSLLAARCAVEVKSEFVIENRTLIAYKGKGGDVVIPDDEGIMTIGAFAFCHYDLDNEKEVETDEDGNYDMDDKKSPLGNDTVTSVVIPDGVETVEKYAFYNCHKLSDVTLPETCKTIGESAFEGCEVLENVNFENVTVIGKKAFYNCESLTCDDLGGVDLSSIYALGDYAFAKTRIREAILTNLSRSGVGAFSDCSKLETVELGRKTRIAESMFENTPVKSIVMYCDTVPDKAFKGCEKLTSVEIVGDLTYLGEEAFSGCKKLATVTFGGVCEQIAPFAFYGCSSLETLTLPNCAFVLGDCALMDSDLTELVFAENTVIEAAGIGVLSGISGLSFNADASAYYKVQDGILYSKDGTRIVMVLPDARLGDFVVPAEVKEIADGAFSYNRYLTSVSFASGSALTIIGAGAFAGCSALKSVTLPEQNVTIGDLAFYDDVALKTINLENVLSVGAYAFEGTSLGTVNLLSNNVTIGEGAFYGCDKLTLITLGAGANIGYFAFCETTVVSVIMNGDGVTVGDGAFYGCANLSTIDFTKITGKLGAYAFYYCQSLTSVNAPYVTELGEACFADCPNLSSFSAERLEVIGDNAFAPSTDENGDVMSASGATFVTFYAPALRVIGEYAFYGCIYLAEIDLSNVTEIGAGAFAICTSLTSVTLSETLTELPDLAFYGCASLTEIDLSHIVRFNYGALYLAQLPAHLELMSAEYIGSLAFIEQDAEDGGIHVLESVNAPNLTYLGDQAFVGCSLLTSVSAPKLEHLGYGAFAYTAIEEFEISSALKEVEFSVFEGTPTFKSFYATVNGEKVYDAEYETVMIRDGVLYMVVNEGYVLTVYPAAKENTEFTVAEGTVRIEYTAAMDNKSLETLILPESMKSIGNYAFYKCDNLKTVVFRSYYAPHLEGTVTGDTIEITPETVEDFPGFDTLYRYDYYFREADIIAMPFYYVNFIAAVGSKAASEMTYILPDNNEGYDTILYKAYFKSSDETSGPTTGKYALAFIEAAKRLPDVVDRFDKKLIDAAINAYNALEGQEDELASVDQALIDRFFAARSEYNVSVAENMIAHLFDMDCSEYSFNLVKEARAFFLSLSEEEQGKVANADVLTQKIEELTKAMGMTPDFEKTFAEHFPEENDAPENDTPDAPTTPDENDTPDEGMPVWAIILIVVGSVLVLAGIGVGIYFIIQKKRAVK